MNKRISLMRLILSLIVLSAGVLLLAAGAYAAEPVTETAPVVMKTENGRALFAFAAVAAVGISCITSSYALARIGTAAMGAMSEKPEVGGRALVFLGMAEGIAIYGLIVAIMLVNKI